MVHLDESIENISLLDDDEAVERSTYINPSVYSDLVIKFYNQNHHHELGVLLYLIMNASHNKYESKGIILERGFVPLSVRKLSEKLQFTHRHTRTIIDTLIKGGELTHVKHPQLSEKPTQKTTQKPTHKYTLLSIVKYDTYVIPYSKNDTKTDTQNDTQKITQKIQKTTQRKSTTLGGNSNKSEKDRHQPNIYQEKEEEIYKNISYENKFSTDAKEYLNFFKKLIPESVRLNEKKSLEAYEKLIKWKKTKEDIFKITDWARKHSFWSGNFFSPAKLTMNDKSGVCYYDLFENQMKNERKSNNGNEPRNGTFKASSEEERGRTNLVEAEKLTNQDHYGYSKSSS